MKSLFSKVFSVWIITCVLWAEGANEFRKEKLSPQLEDEVHASIFKKAKTNQAGALTEHLLANRQQKQLTEDYPRKRSNFIDHFIFEKMERDGVPSAASATDLEFLRRVTLDLTGRIPSPQEVREFIVNPDPTKRDKLIDRLVNHEAYVDKWTYFLMDLLRANGKMGRGRYLFHYWMKENLNSDRPYDEVVRALITASAKSNHVVASANLIAREHIQGAPQPQDGDDFSMVQQLDTHDELSIIYAKAFLGINLSCVSCHDGQGHLEKVNVYLSGKTREQFFQNAAFLAKTRYLMYWENGKPQSGEFLIDDGNPGYDTVGASMIRVPRLGGSSHPAFLLTG